MQTKNKPTWETQQSQEGIIAEAEYEDNSGDKPEFEYVDNMHGEVI